MRTISAGSGAQDRLRDHVKIFFGGETLVRTGSYRDHLPGRGMLTSLLFFALIVISNVAQGGTLTLVETGGSFASGNLSTESGAAAFAQDVLAAGTIPSHQTPHLNDGLYGNSNSWIGGVDGSFAGVAFSTTTSPGLSGQRTVNRIAFGRDNTGVFGDRSDGTYTIQYTTEFNPNDLTPSSEWKTIDSTVVGGNAARKVYEFDPVLATGFRVLTDSATPDLIAIDELESYESSLRLAEVGGTIGTGLLSSTAFAKDEIGGGLLPAHQTEHLNDGIYGNANSWIGDSSNSFAGLSFSGLSEINRFAFGRDNLGVFNDRSAGTYTLQYTLTPNPDENTLNTDWITLDTLEYGTPDGLRHAYEFDPVLATGIRLKADTPGTGIDELEVYGTVVVPEPSSIVLMGIAGIVFAMTMCWRRAK